MGSSGCSEQVAAIRIVQRVRCLLRETHNALIVEIEAVPGGIGGCPRRPGTPYGRFILQTAAGTVRSGGNASTVRKP